MPQPRDVFDSVMLLPVMVLDPDIIATLTPAAPPFARHMTPPALVWSLPMQLPFAAQFLRAASKGVRTNVAPWHMRRLHERQLCDTHAPTCASERGLPHLRMSGSGQRQCWGIVQAQYMHGSDAVCKTLGRREQAVDSNSDEAAVSVCADHSMEHFGLTSEMG